MDKKKLEIKKIDKKIELDTTTEGWFDCGNCTESKVRGIYLSFIKANVGECTFEVVVTKKNTLFAPS